MGEPKMVGFYSIGPNDGLNDLNRPNVSRPNEGR